MPSARFVRCLLSLIAVMAVWLLTPAGGEPVPNPSLSDDQVRSIVALFNLDYPGLEKVRAAADRQDWQAAKRELAGYYRTRKEPRWPYPLPDTSAAEAKAKAAEAILKHEFTLNRQTAKLAEKIDWSANPVGDREWTWSLNRHWQFRILGDAYIATRNERYAREFADELVDWIQSCPPPADGAGGASWRTIEAGIRMFSSWVPSWFTYADSPSFTDDARLLMLKSFAEHADFLVKFPKGGNWLLMESNGLGHVGVFFPEFKGAEAWRKTAFERLEREMARQVYPDGMQFELTTAYHQVSLFNFLQPMVLAAVGKIEMPSSYVGGLKRMIQFDRDVARPDDTLPMLNDADTMRLESIRRSVERDTTHLPKPLQTELSKAFQGTSHGKSVLFPNAGLTVMRSGTDPDARYLLMDAGPFGAGHQHEDKLSIDCYAFGQPLILDPGRFSYTGEGGWFRGPRAHNAALVDDQGQNRRELKGAENLTNGPAPGIRWESGEGFDFAQGVYASGFGPGNALKVTHTRKVLFLKPDYWVVSDLFEGDGRHKIEQLWHFNEGRAAVDPEQAIDYIGPKARLRVAPARPERVQAQLYIGTENPRRGWVSPEYNVRFPAPEAGVTSELDLPAALETVLYPARVDKAPQIQVRALTVEGDRASVSDGEASALEIKSGSSRDTVLFTHAAVLAPAMKRFGDFSSDAEIAMIRERPAGGIRRLALVNGRELFRGGQRILHCASPAERLEVEFVGRTARFAGPLAGEIRLFAPGITQIKLNGREVASRMEAGERVFMVAK